MKSNYNDNFIELCMPYSQTHAPSYSVYELVVLFAINFSCGFEEVCGKRKYKCAIPKIQDTNQIASFDSIGCFANIALLVKKKNGIGVDCIIRWDNK